MLDFGDELFDFNHDGELNAFEEAMKFKFINDGMKFRGYGEEDEKDEDDDW